MQLYDHYVTIQIDYSLEHPLKIFEHTVYAAILCMLKLHMYMWTQSGCIIVVFINAHNLHFIPWNYNTNRNNM